MNVEPLNPGKTYPGLNAGTLLYLLLYSGSFRYGHESPHILRLTHLTVKLSSSYLTILAATCLMGQLIRFFSLILSALYQSFSSEGLQRWYPVVSLLCYYLKIPWNICHKRHRLFCCNSVKIEDLLFHFYSLSQGIRIARLLW